MSIVTLSQAKAHLRVDDSYEDAIIQLYLDAAEMATSNYLGRALVVEAVEGNALVMNDAVRAAVLLQAGNLYLNREASTEKPTSELVMGAKWLLDPYRLGMGV